MYKAKFYHGLSKKEWDQIKKQRRFNFRKDTGRWLAMSGVYFFRDNPILAYRWASRKENRLESLPKDPKKPKPPTNSPIVLQVELKKHNSIKSLDLTTDQGMQLLFWAHRLLTGIVEDDFGSVTTAIRHSALPDAPYYTKLVKNFLKTKLSLFGFSKSEVKKLLNKLSKEFVATKKNDINDIFSSLLLSVTRKGYSKDFNFDCAVITLLVLRYKFNIVIAAIQEGQTLNERFHEHSFRSKYTEGYQGIRAQDHIEICVTDHQVIKWPPKVIQVKRDDYDPDYWNAATEIRGRIENGK